MQFSLEFVKINIKYYQFLQKSNDQVWNITDLAHSKNKRISIFSYEKFEIARSQR